MLPAHNELAPEASRRRFRKLRIAWSGAWGVAAVLLCVLCVRSYWRMDVVHFPTSQEVLGNSAYGVFQVNIFPKGAPTGWEAGWGWTSMLLDKARKRPTWRWSSGNFLSIHFPAWLPVLATFVIGAFPCAIVWIPFSKRFSLRTLLIATTLVAVGLGLIVWLR